MAIQVAQKDAERVTQAAIGFGDLLEEVFAEWDFVLPIDAGSPEADDVGAVLVVEMRGVDGFAGFIGFGFGEFLFVLIDHKAVGHDGFVRCVSAVGGGEHERALKPTPMLVGGFEVEIGGAVQLGMGVQYGGV